MKYLKLTFSTKDEESGEIHTGQECYLLSQLKSIYSWDEGRSWHVTLIDGYQQDNIVKIDVDDFPIYGSNPSQ